MWTTDTKEWWNEKTMKCENLERQGAIFQGKKANVSILSLPSLQYSFKVLHDTIGKGMNSLWNINTNLWHILVTLKVKFTAWRQKVIFGQICHRTYKYGPMSPQMFTIHCLFSCWSIWKWWNHSNSSDSLHLYNSQAGAQQYSMLVSHPEPDVRGKWSPCEYGPWPWSLTKTIQSSMFGTCFECLYKKLFTMIYNTCQWHHWLHTCCFIQSRNTTAKGRLFMSVFFTGWWWKMFTINAIPNTRNSRGFDSGAEPASCYSKVTGSIVLVCMSKCPWARHWTPNCSWCAPSVYECMYELL